MYTITYTNQKHDYWNSEYVFNSFQDAKDYLLNKGFSSKQGVFEREHFNWSFPLKAYVELRKVYSVKNPS